MRHLLLVLCIHLVSAVASSGSLYVDDNAANDPAPGNPLVSDPAEDGTQDHPFDAIQEAIDYITDPNTQNEVIILPGTYTGQGNRDIDFKGKPITIKSTNPDDPDTVAATIIDCQGTEENPHRGFYFHTGETESSVLKGLTVTGGYADKGGGVLCDNAHPVIVKCVLKGNTADNTDGAHSGGGVHCSNSHATILECRVEENDGGGISSYRSDISISRCFILRNNTRSGGGIFSFSGSPLINDCIIKENEAQVGGGGINCAPNSRAIISTCLITGNRSAGGGGVACSGDTIITQCLISGNTSLGSGGAVSTAYCSINISSCTIVGNRTDKRGGGIFCDELANVTVSNSIIRANSAPAASQMGYPQLPDENGRPRGITISYSSVQEAVEGWGFTTWQNGNIDTVPLFANPGHWNGDNWLEGDYHLKSYAGRWNPARQIWQIDDQHSPCIDAGHPAADYSAEPPYNGRRINMGAYGNTQYASKTANCTAYPLGDLDNDCKVTFTDLAIIASNWLTCNLSPPTACN